VDISWNVTAFESLVTDRPTKELIHALVTNQLAAEKGTDLIGGKGNGLTMLLHGGPGTGKTFTAESVAEIAHKPLYRVTCGDIGTTPKDVEMYLDSVLHLGKIWGCVVLLDEADIFLEERTLDNLDRNALVSTFLRTLEYYSGILILTSNRVGHFDEAFKSRIQLALYYQNLDRGQRRQIWRNFFRRLEDLKETSVNYGDLERHVNDLADHEMNGREIRNAITTARQLAIYRKQPLDFASLHDVIKTSSMFDKYLLELNHGNSGDDIAREYGKR
jgi:SpoVK/Ycf46/Vps4 family AAA+-type ATPase